MCEFVKDADGVYDYSACAGVNTMRAITQNVLVYCILFYVGSFGIELRAAAKRRSTVGSA